MTPLIQTETPCLAHLSLAHNITDTDSVRRSSRFAVTSYRRRPSGNLPHIISVRLSEHFFISFLHPFFFTQGVASSSKGNNVDLDDRMEVDDATGSREFFRH
jgi:hypothetical protein